MPGVSKDQIKRAREVNILDYILRYESGNVRRVGNGYRLKDHPSLAVSSGMWYWHSHEVGGKTALDYLTDVRGYGLVEAVCTLLGEAPAVSSSKTNAKPPMQSVTPKFKPPPAPLERLPFTLPLRNKDNNRAFAYLQSRGIDKRLILDCIERGILYENARYHNCVFVGRDENGKARFAAMRGTFGAFKCDAEGSDKRYGFALPPNDPDSHEIAVFEAPIDALSHQTLCKQGFIPPFDGWRLSLGGTSSLALTHFLERHSKVTHCLVCTDNDEAGERTAASIAVLPGITTARSPPASCNDWNELLGAVKKAERTQNRARHNGELCL